MTNEEKLIEAFGSGYFTLEQAMEVLEHTHIESTKRALKKIGSKPITHYRVGVEKAEQKGERSTTNDKRLAEAFGNRGFTPEQPVIHCCVYYLKIEHKDRLYYKIGVTTKSIKNRYSKIDRDKISGVVYYPCPSKSKALELESHIKNRYWEYLYTGEDTILAGAPGNTEIFTTDVLKWEFGRTKFSRLTV